MSRNDDIPLRVVLSWPAMVLGASLGYGIAEVCWRLTHFQGLHMWEQPRRPASFFVMAILVSIACGVLGLAITRYRDIPSGEEKGVVDET